MVIGHLSVAKLGVLLGTDLSASMSLVTSSPSGKAFLKSLLGLLGDLERRCSEDTLVKVFFYELTGSPS